MAWHNSGSWRGLRIASNLQHILAELAYAINEREALADITLTDWVALGLGTTYPSASDFNGRHMCNLCSVMLDDMRSAIAGMLSAFVGGDFVGGDGEGSQDIDDVTTTTNYGPGWYGAGDAELALRDVGAWEQIKEILEENLVTFRYGAAEPTAYEYRSRSLYNNTEPNRWYYTVIEDRTYGVDFSGKYVRWYQWYNTYDSGTGRYLYGGAQIYDKLWGRTYYGDDWVGSLLSTKIHLKKVGDSSMNRNMVVSTNGGETVTVSAGDDAYVDAEPSGWPTIGTPFRLELEIDSAETPPPFTYSGYSSPHESRVEFGNADGRVLSVWTDISGLLTYG